VHIGHSGWKGITQVWIFENEVIYVFLYINLTSKSRVTSRSANIAIFDSVPSPVLVPSAIEDVDCEFDTLGSLRPLGPVLAHRNLTLSYGKMRFSESGHYSAG
jgi:hypothetical protein